MLPHFLRAWVDSGKLFKVLREYGAGETPQAPMAPRRLPYTPAESKCLELKSTAKVSTANEKLIGIHLFCAFAYDMFVRSTDKGKRKRECKQVTGKIKNYFAGGNTARGFH